MALAVPAFAQEISGNFAGGSIKIGDDTVACGVGRYGAIRFNTNKFQGCSTGGWVDIGTFGGGGSSVWVDGGSGKVYYNGGNVGIGTTAPSHLITIGGGGTNPTLPSNRVSMLLSGPNGSSGVGLNNTGGSSALLQLQSNALYVGTTSSHPLSFRTNDIDQMIITPTGNVGIGTTNPTQKLEVQGNIKVSGDIGKVCVARAVADTAWAQCPASHPNWVIGFHGENVASPEYNYWSTQAMWICCK